MDQTFEEEFLSLLQQLRHVNWDAQLEGITHGEFMALGTILRAQEQVPERPGVYVSSLAEAMAVSVSMVSKLLRDLEAHGWIQRTVDPDSRRNTFVSLTPAGREKYAQCAAQYSALGQTIRAQLGDESLSAFLSLARSLTTCYQETLGVR